jgi:hypothetical protein
LRFWVKLKTLAKAEYVLELEGVDEHIICGEVHENSLADVIGQGCQYISSTFSFVDRITSNLHKSEVSINIQLLQVIVDDVIDRKDLTIFLIQMEKCLQLIEIGCVREIYGLKS